MPASRWSRGWPGCGRGVSWSTGCATSPPPSDHLHLALLIAIGLSAWACAFVAPTDIVAVKAFMLGLMRLDIQPLPTDPLLLLHLTLVALL